jgi:geranylgeranyl transferase type-1 subunit beta
MMKSLAMTYSALVALVTLDDDLSRLDVPKLSQWISTVQDDDGSFRGVGFGSESDTRFLYSAVATCCITRDWSGLNAALATEFIMNCWNPGDGGFGLRPGQESHGGATYTAVAALSLMKKLDLLTKEHREGLVRFCVFRQIAGCGGFNGRANKDCDTCYAYWVGATMQILDCDDFINRTSLSRFLDTTFGSLIGGFSKTTADTPDPYHTHFGICARTFCKQNSKELIHAGLGLSMRAFSSHFGAATVI